MLISGSVQVGGIVNTVSCDFKSKLAMADFEAKLYFENKSNYNEVIELFEQALEAEIDQSLAWAHLARFFFCANLLDYTKSRSHYKGMNYYKIGYIIKMGKFSDKSFKNSYNSIMDKEIS